MVWPRVCSWHDFSSETSAFRLSGFSFETFCSGRALLGCCGCAQVARRSGGERVRGQVPPAWCSGLDPSATDISNVPIQPPPSWTCSPVWAAAAGKAFRGEVGALRLQSAAECSCFLSLWVCWTSVKHLCSHWLLRSSFCARNLCVIFDTLENNGIAFI